VVENHRMPEVAVLFSQKNHDLQGFFAERDPKDALRKDPFPQKSH